MLFLCSLWVVLFVPSLALAQTLAEVLKQPSAFDQQTVTVTGQVANVTTRYGETVSTTFDLLDAQGAAIAILVSGVPKCKQGEVCKISGLFVAQKKLVLPEKIERVAERPFESAGVLFHQRRTGGSVAGGRSLRDVYIPELEQQ
jgi:hypothetical protein